VRIPLGPEPAPVTSVADVIARMQQLSATLPQGDGVRAFNEMYRVTTEHVEAAIDSARFADPEFMTRLDVQFANLYLVALARLEAESSSAPRSWRALFEVRDRPGISQLQFAVAGMNAHINYDLPRALVLTVHEMGGTLDSTRLADYKSVNLVLAQTQPIVQRELLTGPFAALDAGLGDRDDEIAMWGIEQAREFAWTTAQTLWALRATVIEKPFTDKLDRFVELTSRLLLRAHP
jgi:Family of unknown function (DUF5995)